VAEPSKIRTDFTSSNSGIVGSNPTKDMDVCVRFLCVCVVLCIGISLEWADPSSKECIG
jgi:hypothetical protein